ncbi:pyridoxal-dependent decarboxylase [Actinacidiphila glaucinigra]|uniref:pyridoxal-dependent decarboxylase n=1 Tax=Actinacidiphila glaucinigra TaxID=235986 RepID=UPI003690A8BB
MRASVVPVPTIADLAIRALPWDPAEHLNQAARRMRGRQSRTLGFPGNAKVDLSAYGSLLSVLFNNVGDPQSTDATNIGAKTYELALLEYFAHVAGAAPRLFGYVASSSSEALLHRLYTARQALPDAVLYASDQAHYSVARACEVLRVEMVTVASRPDGSMDPQDLAEQAALRARGRIYRRRVGAIVVAACGSTMRGAVDDIRELRRAAAVAGPVHLHVDAAGGALIAAHTDPAPRWSFADTADSMNISAHKVLGLPVPAGISLVRAELVTAADSGEYLATTDHTLACSRSGLAVLLLWARLQELGQTGVAAMIGRCQDVAAYAVERLAEAGVNPSRFPGSLTVCFDRPPAAVARRWHLACEGGLAHIVTTGHVTRAAIDELAADLAGAGRGTRPEPIGLGGRVAAAPPVTASRGPVPAQTARSARQGASRAG